MSRPLFIHTDSQILGRLSEESSGHALVTTSMVDALKWITSPGTHLSGIFINPEDSHFSALKFIEITLSHRPALPIFLFQPKLDGKTSQIETIIRKTRVQGIFLGTEPYSTLMIPLRQNLLPSDLPRSHPQRADAFANMIAIPITDFSYGTHYPYNLFLTDSHHQLRLFAEKGAPVNADYLLQATQKNPFLYVKKEELEAGISELRQTRADYLNSELPSSWKISETLSRTREVLNAMRSAGIDEPLLEYTKSMLNDLFRLVDRIDSEEGAIHGMIDQARKCERSVFCASYAVLVARHLKYERNATLEILGLASVLQDLALFRTPYGDLSERLPEKLNKEEHAYYLKHPTLSADLAASNNDIPEVTLQVIRQHHERKDKTGFPHRIGGSQLHPMAEILSIINAYFDVTHLHTNDSETIETLKSEVFQHYSENTVKAFKGVLSKILTDKAKIAQVS